MKRHKKTQLAIARAARQWLWTPDGQVTPEEVYAAWKIWAGPAQLPPEGHWRIWLMMGGRGAGKTRAGAEWVRSLAEKGNAQRIALVGPALHDVREVMIGGPSGLCSVAAEGCRPTYHPSRRRLVWPNGVEAYAFSAEDPESLRGPQFDAAWCDEIGAWAHDEATWDTLMFGLRLGVSPRVVATTTPQPRKLVMRLADMFERRRGGIEMTRAPTRSNQRNLAPGFVEAIEETYGGTRIALQELDGELIKDAPGALFTRSLIERGRVRAGEVSGEGAGFERVVVGLDPPAGTGSGSACGIIVAGLRDRTVYVLADASVRGLRPLEWAKRAVAAARVHGAGMIVAEANQGGEMVRQMLEMGGATGACRVVLRHARESKLDRAGPVSGLYEQGRVKHAGVFRELEGEMCVFGAEGERMGSPDRVDALVWAVRELTDRRALPSVIDILGPGSRQ